MTKTISGNDAAGFTYERDLSDFAVGDGSAIERLNELVHRHDSPAQPAIDDLEAGRSQVHLSSDDFLDALRDR